MRARWAVLGTVPFAVLLFFAFLIRPPPVPAAPPAELSVLVGVLTRPEKYAARHLLRLVYGTQPAAPLAQVDVRFVLCRLATEEQRLLVALEILRFGDVIVLNCTENMNSGKTHTFFSSLPGILPRRYDYVMKADDDAFIRVAPLAAALRPLSRHDLYFGYGIPCAGEDPYAGYMSGMGYALSWDLVEWIAASEIPVAELRGPEDKLVGRWLDRGKKAAHRHTAKRGMYDYPGVNGRCSHELVPETVAVHRLKTLERWTKVLRFFNATAALLPSKLYHFE